MYKALTVSSVKLTLVSLKGNVGEKEAVLVLLGQGGRAQQG